MNAPAENLYRYVDACDVVLLETYPVVRRTPKGCWIQVAPGYPKPRLKFVLNDATKRYACDTTDAAKVSFLARKRRQLSILNSRVAMIEACVDAINEGRIAGYNSSMCFE